MALSPTGGAMWHPVYVFLSGRREQDNFQRREIKLPLSLPGPKVRTSQADLSMSEFGLVAGLFDCLRGTFPALGPSPTLRQFSFFLHGLGGVLAQNAA